MTLRDAPYPPGAICDALACLERSMQPWQRTPWIGKAFAMVGVVWRWVKGKVMGQ